jgi:hypothetical protein
LIAEILGLICSGPKIKSQLTLVIQDKQFQEIKTDEIRGGRTEVSPIGKLGSGVNCRGLKGGALGK